ncbi:macrolide export protein MacA [bacterium BMS3Bbin11]|nr:macrolide export protein MacA [bacterium BMS3Abin11]GBE45902.1 macrolide export protein MacA [bacterium BMS3Bbin11]GMT40822.1 MAG: hypothetical protein IEMM0001_1557 [bacterium]
MSIRAYKLLRIALVTVVLTALVLLMLTVDIRVSTSTAMAKPVVMVETGPLEVWSNYSGEINSQRVTVIMSKMLGRSTITELEEEGKQVEKGDVLARFDSAEIEQTIIKLEREHTLASTSLDSLINAKIPMELEELSSKMLELKGRLSYEQAYLADSRRLLKEKIVSPQEVQKQQSKVDQLRVNYKSVSKRHQLTIDHLNPLAIKQATAKVSAAEQELEIAKRQLSNSVIYAPARGVVVYNPLYFGNEYRSIRVGDPVYANQRFMVLPDMQLLKVNFYIPESELSRVGDGQDVLVRPVSNSETRLLGKITHIGTAAQKLPGKPQWQRYFQVTVSIEQSENEVRPGMSVVVHVRSYNNQNAIRIPRRVVNWDGKLPFVYLEQNGEKQKKDITLGQANTEYIEVIGGLVPGDKVFVE